MATYRRLSKELFKAFSTKPAKEQVLYLTSAHIYRTAECVMGLNGAPLGKIIGITIALAVIGIVAYFMVFAPKSRLNVEVISKEIGIGDTPMLFVNAKIFGEDKVVRIVINSNARSVLNSLREGQSYELECVDFFGSWNCSKIIAVKS